MQINHLHLHVQDVAKSRAFYERYFGLKLKFEIAKDFIFLTDDAGMDFALSVEKDPQPMPDWFHFGFRLPSANQVRELHARMKTDGTAVEEIAVYGDRITFAVPDPDGYGVEVYASNTEGG